MIRTIAFNKDGCFFETYLFKFGAIRKILVKRNGKPFQIIRFHIKDGRKWDAFETPKDENLKPRKNKIQYYFIDRRKK